MPAFAFVFSLFLLASQCDVSGATACFGGKRKKLVHRSCNRSFIQRSFMRERDVPVGCEGFYEERDDAGQNKNEDFYDAAAVTASRAVIAAAGGAASVAGAAASGGTTLGLAVVGGIVFPDTTSEQLENLESGMTCLMSAVSRLQQDVADLEEKLEAFGSIMGHNSMQFLKDMSTTINLQAKEHLDCAALMKCVADTKYMKDKKYSVSWCEHYMETEFKITKIETNCNALAFQQKFNQHDAYHDIHDDLALGDPITTIINTSLEEMYPAAHSLLAAYTAIAGDLFLAWTAVEAWAVAICYPGLGKSTCNSDNVDLVRKGLSDFEKDKNVFMNNFVTLKDMLNSSDFLLARRNNNVTIKLPTTGTEECYRKHTSVRTKEEVKNHWSSIGFGDHTERYTKVESEYEVLGGCKDDELKKLYCGNYPCSITKTDLTPFHCSSQPCNTFKNCDKENNYHCHCGQVHCREWELKFQYDHLYEQIEAMDNISGYFSQRNMSVPPYSLEDESSYPLSTYFCDQKLKKKFQKKHCNK